MQLAIDFAPTSAVLYEPRSRLRDPETSKAAASSAKELQARHQMLILEALERGPAGKDLIADRCCLDGVAVCRRLTELSRAGLIRDTGRTEASNAGRAERVWELA